MAQHDYLIEQDKKRINKETNILDLIKKSRLNKAEEKKHIFVYVTLSILLLFIVTNIIIF